MEESIFNPRIPYIGPINGGQFRPGKVVTIQGLAPGIAYRFNINLQCGRETVPRNDVAVQISVRLLDEYISLNSLQQGIWGEEQLGTLALKRNEKFEIAIACDFNRYKVSINGRHYCEFPQRIHHSRITYLAIDGDVSIYKIMYESTTEVSGNGLASAPMPTPPEDNEMGDFEFIGVTTNRPYQAGTRVPPRDIGFSEPPSYEAAIDSSNRPPYPTSGPIGMPRPVHGSGTGAPYPTSNTSSMPCPTSTTTYRPYPTAVTVCTTPLTTPLSSNRRRPTSYFGKKCAIASTVVLAIIIIIIVVAIKGGFGRRGDTYNYSNSYEVPKSSYGNSYGYDQYGHTYNG